MGGKREARRWGKEGEKLGDFFPGRAGPDRAISLSHRQRELDLVSRWSDLDLANFHSFTRSQRYKSTNITPRL